MMYLILKIGLMLNIFNNIDCSDDYCSMENGKSCRVDSSGKKYSRDSNEQYAKYYQAINDAEKAYVKCNDSGCQCFDNVISEDLAPFRERGINQEMIESVKDRGTLYQLIDGHLYRDKDCMFPARCTGVEHFILKISRNISNTEFIINTRDYPQISRHFSGPLPVFSFSKTAQYYDIMYPAWSFWEGGPAISLYPRGLGRWDQHRLSLNKTSMKIPWNSKKEIAFFRGSRTSSERDNLIYLSRKKPNLVDAKYTKNQAWKSEKDTLNASPAEEVSLEEHCNYKYLFNFRGVAASFRHKHLFLCHSLVFHVGDEWTEFYYGAMKPWIHYIPVSRDTSQSQLEELIQFARDNDEISERIANRGRNFIWKKLKMSDVLCYWEKLLGQYTKILNFVPSLRNNLIEIYEK